MCLNVSIIDGLDILLFINRGDIFAKSILVLWSFVTAMTLNASLIETPPVYSTPLLGLLKLNRCPGCLLDDLPLLLNTLFG